MIDAEGLQAGTTIMGLGLIGGGLMLGAEVIAAARRPALRLPEPPAVRPELDTSVVWIGDSTAAGHGASSPYSGLPQRLSELLGRPGHPVVLARGGDRIRDVLLYQVPALGDLAPSVIFISVGANDTVHLTSRSSFRREYEAVLGALPAGIPVVILGIPDMGALPRLRQPLRALAGRRGRYLDVAVRELAMSRPGLWRYVDICGLTGREVRRSPARYLAADGYHPSDVGYQLCADAMAAEFALSPLEISPRVSHPHDCEDCADSP
ncbi:MAG: SGNH/GDSL hydrolase family protein [Actinomycetota bacterium]